MFAGNTCSDQPGRACTVPLSTMHHWIGFGFTEHSFFFLFYHSEVFQLGKWSVSILLILLLATLVADVCCLRWCGSCAVLQARTIKFCDHRSVAYVESELHTLYFFFFFFIEQLFLHLFGFLIHNKNTNLQTLSLNRKNTLHLFHQSNRNVLSCKEQNCSLHNPAPQTLHSCHSLTW